jgi:hypothetical protein
LDNTFTISVFHTQVGPKNKKLQSGLFGSPIQVLLLIIDLTIASIASFCHIIFSFIFIFSFFNLSMSVLSRFETGIQEEILSTF